MLDEQFWQWQRQFAPSAYLLALSGGRDSMALLHVLHANRQKLSAPLTAIYINHGWHENAGIWGEQVIEWAKNIAVPCQQITIQPRAAKGREAAAREARYAALEKQLIAGAVLLTGHHLEDQIETLLLALLRGSGLRGLAAMPTRRSFGKGEHWRVLLGVSRATINNYVQKHAIKYIDDPSNDDPRYKRNLLRSTAMMALQQHFGNEVANIARSAQLLAEAQQLQTQLLAPFIACDQNQRLNWQQLKTYDAILQKNALRTWMLRCHPLAPPARQLTTFLEQLNHPNPRHAQLQYDNVLFQHHNGWIWAFRVNHIAAPPPFEKRTTWRGIGVLTVRCGADLLVGKKLRWSLYPPGGKFKSNANTHHKPLKELFRQRQIPPFLRQRTPLLWCDEQLLWVGDFGSAAAWQQLDIHWQKSSHSASIASYF